MARAQGARSHLAAAFETTYGVAPAAGFTRMPFARSSLGAAQPLVNSELLGYGRDPLAPTLDAISADGDVTVPIDVEAFGIWLKATFGPPTTTGASGSFTHVFASGAWALPSLSIETGMPEVPHYAMYTGCKVDQLSWSMRRSGLLTASVRVVAQGEDVAPASAAGTLAEVDLDRFGAFHGEVRRNGAALGNVVSADIAYANSLDPVEVIRSDGKLDGVDPTIAALTGRMDVRFADRTLFDQAIAGEDCELEFAYVMPSGQEMRLTAHSVFLPRPRVPIEGPAGVQASFDWQAARPDGAPNRMATITLKNGRATY